jgi:hypothetical protein
MTTENACTWVGCNVGKGTEPLLDAGRAWAHLCHVHKLQYDAEMTALRLQGGLFSSQKEHRALTFRACGGEQAWKKYVFGPFGGAAQREKRKILAGQDEPLRE